MAEKTDHESPPMDEFLASLVNGHEDEQNLFFDIVAERIRARLEPAEASVVASLFERMRNGEAPSRVFRRRPGRKPGTTNRKHIKGKEVSLPDPFDLCWKVRQLIRAGNEPSSVFASVARQYQRNPEYIRDLYKATLPKLGDDTVGAPEK